MKLETGLPRWATVLAFVVTAIVGLGGCETFNLVNPFSSGNDAYSDAESAWSDGEYAEALSDAAYAIARDEKHYKAMQFLIDNYETAIGQIDEELATLSEGEPTYDKLVRKAEIYDDLYWFYAYVSDEGDTAVTIERGRNSIEIPIRDISENIAAVQTQGMELAEVEAMALIEAEDFEGAEEVISTAASRFTSDDEEADTLRARYAGIFADRAEEIMANLTVDNHEEARFLLVLARGLNRDSERIIALSERLPEEAIAVILAAADEVASAGTKEAAVEALEFTSATRSYIDEIDAYRAVRAPYVEGLLEAWPQHIAELEAAYDGSIDQAVTIRAEHNDMLYMARDWSEHVTFDHEAGLRRMKEFVELSTVRVAVVSSREFSASTRRRLASQVRSALYDTEDQNRWFFFFTEDDIDLEHNGRLDLLSGADSEYQALMGQVNVFASQDDAYLDAVYALRPDATTDELNELGIDYVIKLTADVEELDLDTNERTEDDEKTFYLTEDGEFTDNPIITTMLRPTWNETKEQYDDEADAREAFNQLSLLQDNGVEAAHFDIPYTRVYEWESGEQEIEIEVEAVRVSDERRLFRDRFDTVVPARSPDRLVEIVTDFRDLEDQILEYEGGVDSESAPAGVSAQDVGDALEENLEMEDLVEAFLRG